MYSYSLKKSFNRYWLDGLISGLGSVVSGALNYFSNKDATKVSKDLGEKQIAAVKAANDKNVEAQLSANRQNVESQERINQQNVDMTRELNSIMRRDSRNSITDKKADLLRAGYSVADPSLQGFTAASLMQPSLTAPSVEPTRVDPEFSPDIASSIIASKQADRDYFTKTIDQMVSTAKSIAEIKKLGSEKEGQDIQNEIQAAWGSSAIQAQIGVLSESATKLYHDGVLSHKTSEKIEKELPILSSSLQLINEQVTELKTKNKYLDESQRKLLEDCEAHISSLKASASLSNAEKDLKVIQKEFDDIKLSFAKLGINFDASDVFSSIFKILGSPNSESFAPTLINGAKSLFLGLIKSLTPW